LHTTGLAPAQAPAWQVSAWVQAFPSSHEVPSAFAGFEHIPVAASHAPALRHGSGAEHTTGLAPAQAPAWQVSVWVQALPSLHEEPSAFAGVEHVPVAGSHTPALWHWSGDAHTTGLAPVHMPA
jgi:hypothetical protein